MRAAALDVKRQLVRAWVASVDAIVADALARRLKDVEALPESDAQRLRLDLRLGGPVEEARTQFAVLLARQAGGNCVRTPPPGAPRLQSPGSSVDDTQRAEVGEFLQAIEDNDDVQRVWAAVK